jgi:hypothetical protein
MTENFNMVDFLHKNNEWVVEPALVFGYVIRLVLLYGKKIVASREDSK